MALVTAAELRTAGIPQLTGSADDTYLGTLIGRAEAMIARSLGFPPASVGGTPALGSTSYTLDHDGVGGRDLSLRVWPATAITSVYDDPTRLFTSASYLVSSSDYSIVDGGRTLRLKDGSTWGAWGTGVGRIRVAFTAGYSTGPDDLKQAVIELCQDMLRRRSPQAQAVPGGAPVVPPSSWIPNHIAVGIAHLRVGDLL